MRFLNKSAVALMVMLLALALAVPALAAGEPTFKRYPQTVDAPFVKDVVDGRVAGYIFDARPYKKKYLKGHIPGAVNLPATQFDKNLGKLPQDKSALIIYYCGGLKCALSHKAAFKTPGHGLR